MHILLLTLRVGGILVPSSKASIVIGEKNGLGPLEARVAVELGISALGASGAVGIGETGFSV
jgi:hypothetical protein